MLGASLQRTPRGAIFGTLFRLVGKPIFRRYARDTLENLRKLEQARR